MKLSGIFLAVAVAQDERSASLNRRIENAQAKCAVFMERAMVCDPPATKIGKYTFRLDKVLLDARHHLMVGKCDMDSGMGYRRRRDAVDDLNAEFDALMAEINEDDDHSFTGKQYGTQTSINQLNKLQGLCTKFIGQVFDDQSLANCPKLQAWKNRSDELLDDLNAMKNVCLKQAAEMKENGGNYGEAKPKPTKAPKPKPTAAYNAPTKKPKRPKKPSKKPSY